MRRVCMDRQKKGIRKKYIYINMCDMCNTSSFITRFIYLFSMNFSLHLSLQNDKKLRTCVYSCYICINCKYSSSGAVHTFQFIETRNRKLGLSHCSRITYLSCCQDVFRANSHYNIHTHYHSWHSFHYSYFIPDFLTTSELVSLNDLFMHAASGLWEQFTCFNLNTNWH